MSADLISAMTTGFNSVQTSFNSIVSAALPIGLSIFGIGFAIKKGVSFFKSVSN